MLEENSFGKYTRQEVQEIYNETKGKLNFYNKSIGRYFALLLASGAAAELAKVLRDLLYGKGINKKPEEWVLEFANETFVEWIPMVGAFVNMVNYGSINSMPLQAVYNIGSNVVALFEKLSSGKSFNGEITNLVFGIGEALGISLKNVKNIVSGVTNIFGGGYKALQLNNLLFAYSNSYLSNQFNETGDPKYLKLLMNELNIDENITKEPRFKNMELNDIIKQLEKEEDDYRIEVGDVFLHIDSSHDSFYIIKIKSATYRDPTRNNAIVYTAEIISSNVEFGSPSHRNTGMYRDEILAQYKKIDPEHFKKVYGLFNEYTTERTDLNIKYHKLMTEIIKENIQ